MNCDVRYCNGIKGLMFEKEDDFDYALVFRPPFKSKFFASIHSLFVEFEFVALFLDENYVVVDKVLVKPWTFNYTPKKPCVRIVELPSRFSKDYELGSTCYV